MKLNKELNKSRRSQSDFEKLMDKDVPKELKKCLKNMKKLKRQLEKEEKRKDEIKNRKPTMNPSNFNPREEQTYVPKGKYKPKGGPKTGPSFKPKKTIGKSTSSSVKLVPNKYFRDTVLHYTGKTMTSPVADKKEIDKMYKKISLHIHAASTKYQKLSSTEQKEADEIFKKIKAEKEKYVPLHSSVKKKKAKKKQTKRKKKTKNKSFFETLKIRERYGFDCLSRRYYLQGFKRRKLLHSWMLSSIGKLYNDIKTASFIRREIDKES